MFKILLRKIIQSMKGVYNYLQFLLQKIGLGEIKLRKFSFVDKLYRNLLAIVKKKSIKINDNFIFLDEQDSLGLTLDSKYETGLRKMMEKYINSGDYVIDVGAHIGYHTLFMGNLVGVDGLVTAFEPDKNNFKLLEKNINSNNLDNISIFQKGVGSKSKLGKLYKNSLNTGHNSFVKSETSAEDVSSVEVVRLDKFIMDKELPVPSFVKIDVEGFEFEVIKGMRKILKNKSIKVVMEYSPEWLFDQQSSFEDFLFFLKKHFSTIKLIDKNATSLNKIEKKKLNYDEVLNLDGSDQFTLFLE